IGRSAFFGCSNLKEVVIPKGVSKIERSAFANCANLQEVSIPRSLESLGEWAFMNCTNLNSITLPESTSTESHTFLNCPAEIRRMGNHR
ncbi:MAG: leucine-rich repeat domain-containing protein, partial [Thermoplasmata archaeon]